MERHTEPDIDGYYIYYKTGTSGAPYNGTGAEEGNSPFKATLAELADLANPEYTIQGLSDTETSFIVVTAYDAEGNESRYSNEVSYQYQPPSNVAPSTPVIVYPENGQDEVDEPLNITTDPFSDPNDNAHRQSQWQISDQSDFSTLAVDITSDWHLTAFPVPHMILTLNQTYYVRVRFYDVYLEPSGWSDTVEFTTYSLVEDLNSNGIPDVNEVDDTVDFNLDGIPDNDQPEIIKCVQTEDALHTSALKRLSASILEIEAMGVIDPETIADTANRPADLIFGLFSYRLKVNQPGSIATLKIYFSGEVSRRTPSSNMTPLTDGMTTRNTPPLTMTANQ